MVGDRLRLGTEGLEDLEETWGKCNTGEVSNYRGNVT